VDGLVIYKMENFGLKLVKLKKVSGFMF